MKKVSISYAKAHLSALLKQVRVPDAAPRAAAVRERASHRQASARPGHTRA